MTARARWQRHDALAFAPALAFGLGSFLARILLAHPGPAEAAALAQPLPVVTAWGVRGAQAFAILGASMAVACLAMVSRAQDSTRVVLIATTLALVAALSWPVVFSSDVYAYAVYGERAVSGLDPYLPQRFRDEPVERAAAAQWGNPPPRAVYGPAFIAVAAALAPARQIGVATYLLALRIAAAGALILAVAALTRLRGPKAAAIFGLNPVVVWAAAEGHNDTFAIAAVLAAALTRRAPLRAGWLLAAVWFKAIAFAPALALAAVGPARWRTAVTVALAGLAGYTMLFRSLIVAPPLPGSGAPASAFATFASLTAGLPTPVSRTAALTATAALVMFAAVVAVRVSRREGRGGWAGGALVLWFAAPSVEPWYAVWLAAGAALDWGSPAAAAAIVGTIGAALRYLVDASVPAAVPVNPWIGAGMFLVPAAALAIFNRKNP